jgi:hypothetical protein
MEKAVTVEITIRSKRNRLGIAPRVKPIVVGRIDKMSHLLQFLTFIRRRGGSNSAAANPTIGASNQASKFMIGQADRDREPAWWKVRGIAGFQRTIRHIDL